jgi:hypothetical protein
MMVLASGCQVATTVSVSEPSPGRGSVTVAVALDRAALAALGGLDALRSELSVSDLESAGWAVTGPTGRIDGSAAVSASHPFTNPSQVGGLMAQIAGAGVFRVTLVSHRSFWHTDYRLAGAVDLRCGVNCFGDTGLQSATGNPLGFDPGALAFAEHQTAESALTFDLGGVLPGRVVSTNGRRGPNGSQSWAPQLGQVVTLSATSQTLNEGSVVLTSVAGGVALVILLGGTAVILIGWRRRRSRRRPLTVTPPS